MHIFITGGTGLIGSALIKELLNKQHKVTVLTRNADKARQKLGNSVNCCVSLDNESALNGVDVVINLAGEPIADKRWSKAQKERLCNSRWNITRRLSELIKKSNTPPSAFISGSAVGYYGAQDDAELDENSTPNKDFAHQLCHKWESLAKKAKNPATRACIIRTGIVLAKQGGMLSKLLLPFRFGLGCVLGKGSQYISWIHIDDMVHAIIYLMEHTNANGTFNLTAPHPVTNKYFSKALAKTLHRPCLFRIPSFVIKAALGEMSTMLLDGQRVMPKQLKKTGFQFRFEQIDEALNELLGT